MPDRLPASPPPDAAAPAAAKPPRDPFSRLSLRLAAWGGLTALVVCQSLLVLETRGVPFNPAYIAAALVNGFIWTLVTPLAARLARQFPVAGPARYRHLGIHVAAALGIHATGALLAVLAARPVDTQPTPFGYTYVGTWASLIIFYLTIYTVIVAGVQSYDARRRAAEREAEARDREIRAARLKEEAAALQSQLVQAQLGALRAQLQPHFLFNTLHAASALMTRDVDAARGILESLSDLLRAALDRDDEPEIPLHEEMEVLDAYLRIARTRMGGRLALAVDVAPDAELALVPPLVLQPLVENAVEHGIAPRPGGGQVAIRARRDGEALVLTVEDDGVGLAGGDGAPGAAFREGVGVGNTRQRLAGLYGQSATLVLSPRHPAGVVAEVRLPFHTDTPARVPARPSAGA